MEVSQPWGSYRLLSRAGLDAELWADYPVYPSTQETWNCHVIFEFPFQGHKPRGAFWNTHLGCVGLHSGNRPGTCQRLSTLTEPHIISSPFISMWVWLCLFLVWLPLSFFDTSNFAWPSGSPQALQPVAPNMRLPSLRVGVSLRGHLQSDAGNRRRSSWQPTNRDEKSQAKRLVGQIGNPQNGLPQEMEPSTKTCGPR